MNEDLRAEYARRYKEALMPVARQLENLVMGHLEGISRIERVVARAKDPVRFLAKAERELENGQPKYAYPLSEIQDQIGVRVVVLYKDDVDTVTEVVKRYFREIETRT